MREKRSAKLANKERLQSLVLFTRFSEINDLSNEAIKDQLRAPKLQGTKGFIMSHPTRAQLMLQLQARRQLRQLASRHPQEAPRLL